MDLRGWPRRATWHLTARLPRGHREKRPAMTQSSRSGVTEGSTTRPGAGHK
jgi:hypothetical protein